MPPTGVTIQPMDHTPVREVYRGEGAFPCPLLVHGRVSHTGIYISMDGTGTQEGYRVPMPVYCPFPVSIYIPVPVYP